MMPEPTEKPGRSAIGAEEGFGALFERSLKIRPVELGMTARSRVSTHVDERADTDFLKDCDELLGAASAVTDCEDQAAAALASFFSAFAGVSDFLEAFLSPFFSSPPAACAVSSARSIRVTRASGALSPLRKPFFRMRR